MSLFDNIREMISGGVEEQLGSTVEDVTNQAGEVSGQVQDLQDDVLSRLGGGEDNGQ
jgi:hypothetical protein